MFKKIKLDLDAFERQIQDVYGRIEYGDAGRDIAVLVAERYEELGDKTAAAPWWRSAIRCSVLAVSAGRELIKDSRSPTQRRGQVEANGQRILRLTDVLQRVRRESEAIARLDQEIGRYPTLMMLYQRRAELKKAVGDTDGALTDLALALRANPIRFQKAVADWERKRKDWGLRYFSKLMEQRAELLEDSGRRSAATRQRAAIAKLRSGDLEIVP